MLKELKFVQGAVAKRDFVVEMTHFKIEGGFVQAYNGALALCSPINFDVDCIPQAAPLVKALGKCEETPVLRITERGKLFLSSGRYSGFIECIDEETLSIEPKGERVDFNGELLLAAIEKLLPFTGTDAYRLWTNGILLRGQSAFATNNVCLVEYWLGTEVPFLVNIPKPALHEMLRIGEPPTHAQVDKNSITFHYEDRRWIKSQLLDTGWPNLTAVLDQPSNPQPIDPLLFEGLQALSDSSDSEGRVYMVNGLLLTQPDPEAEKGSRYQLDDTTLNGLYKNKMLMLLDGVATHADFGRYPDPVLFFGDRLRGALIGMRM